MTTELMNQLSAEYKRQMRGLYSLSMAQWSQLTKELGVPVNDRDSVARILARRIVMQEAGQ